MKFSPLLTQSRFRTGIEERLATRPLQVTCLITGSYLVFISLYIWWSGYIVAKMATSVESLATLELQKGLFYVVLTAVLLFVFTYALLSRIKKRDEELLAKNKSIIASERMVMAGLLSSSLCHDINNIMSVIIGNTELCLTSENVNEEDKSYLEEIRRASGQLTAMSKRLMETGKEYIPGDKEYNNLSQLIIETVEFAKIHKKIKTCTIVDEIADSIIAHINAPLICRALMNLLINGADAAGEYGTLHVSLQTDEKWIYLEVMDSGPGIDDNLKEKIFEPFFTSKPDGNGLGLLSLKICAQQHDGTIELDSSPLGGARFRLILPIE